MFPSVSIIDVVVVVVVVFGAGVYWNFMQFVSAGNVLAMLRSNDCGWLSLDVLLPSYECLYNYISFIAQGSVRFVYLQQMICPNVVSYLTQYVR